ncbi:hypothetical protein DM47_2411 [Burkholderia mallei]|nr:hypothetical protein DM47_2411 [Burkholderia mallei]
MRALRRYRLDRCGRSGRRVAAGRGDCPRGARLRGVAAAAARWMNARHPGGGFRAPPRGATRLRRQARDAHGHCAPRPRFWPHDSAIARADARCIACARRRA